MKKGLDVNMKKSSKKKKHKENKRNQDIRQQADKVIFGLLLAAIGIVPLIVMAHTVNVQAPHITTIGSMTSGTKGELFTYYKSLLLLIITITAGAILLAKLFFMGGTIRKTKANIVIAIAVVAIILSTLFSPTISIAIQGTYNRNDGAISWLCYLALFFIAMNIEYPKKAYSFVLYALYPFVIINLIIITMNFYGQDVLQNEWAKNLVTLFLPEGSALGAGSILVGTLNQWNYMSGMFAVMTAMFLMASMLEKNRGQAISFLVASVAAMAVLFMSISTSGFLAVSIVFVWIVLVGLKFEQKRRSFVMLALFIICIAPIFHVLASKDARVWSESIGIIIKNNPYAARASSVESRQDSFTFSLTDKAYAADNSFVLPALPERSMSAGSGRAYIWEQILGLVKERPLLGYGLDTLLYHFPHFNIDARAGMYDEKTIVDKPHSLYMGILYGTGIVGFVAIAALMLMVFIGAVKFVFQRKDIFLAIFTMAWLAYAVQALINDGLPGTSGPLWTIAGMLMAIVLAKGEEHVDGRNN